MPNERWLHEQLHSYLMSGEWYAPTPEVLATIAQIQGSDFYWPEEDQEQERERYPIFVGLRLPIDMLERVKLNASQSGLTLSQAVRRLLNKALA